MTRPRNWRTRSNVRRLQIFVSDLGATGVVRNAIAIANEASASGFQVRLLTCDASGVLRGELGPKVAVVKLVETLDSGAPRRLLLQRALLAYRRHSRAWKPDIMFSAGNHGHLLSTFAWLGLRGWKVLRISNDLSHGSPSLPTRGWRAGKFWLMSRLADRLVYVANAQAHHPLLARHLQSGKAEVISNGVDLDRVRKGAGEPCSHPWALDPSVPLVLAVGRHVKQKNFHTLVNAFARARKSRPMRLLFLGHGNEEEIGRLGALARELGIEDEVDFVPTVANPFPFMKASRALALPSLWEGSSNVILEAMACGTPIVASRTAGDAELVLGQGRYGVLVDPFDTGAMAEALLRQTGPAPILPGDRVSAFSRRTAMDSYLRLFEGLVGEGQLALPGAGQPRAAASPAS